MLNFPQLATVYNTHKQITGETWATASAEVIVQVYGQVQAFTPESATDLQIAQQVVAIIEHLDDTRTDVQISKVTLHAWAWRFINNEPWSGS